jgi:translocation and assembly module TamA
MRQIKHTRPALLTLPCLGLVLFLFATRAVWAADPAVIVEGVTGKVRENVIASLSIYQERERSDLSPARLRRLHELAPEEIRTALQPFGYYRPRIRASLNQDAEGWTARYEIDPGNAIPVALVDIRVDGEGREDPEFRRLIEEFPLRRGDALNHALYEQGKTAFQRLAAERGYFDQRLLRHEVVVDLENYRAEIHLHIDTGRRYRLGEITIEQDVLDPALLARYLKIQPGQPYSNAALLDLQTTLSGTDYFGTVEVVADPKEARDYAIPVRVRLTARRPNRYTFGLGYGTDTGPRGQLGWERRYLNPEGHHTRTELRASKIESSANAGYFIPIRNPRTDQFAITAGYTQSDIQNTDSQVRRIGISRTELRGKLQETLSLTKQNEKFAIGSETGTSDLLIPGITWSYFLGNDRIYTRQGARAQIDLRGASRNVASDASLEQGRLQTKVIVPFFDFGRFIARGDAGGTRIDDFQRLPPSLRFFAGGDMSVRGYAYNSLGPRNSEGTVTGGKHLLVGSLEYEQHLTGDWAAALFYDVGNVFNDFAGTTMKKGAGIGVRWRSPIGQIRLDIASPLNDPGSRPRLHLYIGPDL